MSERVDVIDEHDRVLDCVSRREMRARNLLHRNAAVLCLDSQGRVYAHRRTLHKDVFPGLYDLFASGVVEAGESYEAAAARELAEELGVVGPVPEPLFTHRYEGRDSRSLTRVFRVRWDGPIVHQASEIAWGAFVPLADVAANRLRWQLVPDGAEIFARYLREGF